MSAAQQMSPTARHELNVACLRLGLELEGWEHYLTAMTDEGSSVFAFDHESGDVLRVELASEGRVYSVNGQQVQ